MSPLTFKKRRCLDPLDCGIVCNATTDGTRVILKNLIFFGLFEIFEITVIVVPIVDPTGSLYNTAPNLGCTLVVYLYIALSKLPLVGDRMLVADLPSSNAVDAASRKVLLACKTSGL